MQQSWRDDHDKLTFIACLPFDDVPEEVVAGAQDSPSRMIGDVNLFLSAADDDPEGCVGELELMIARSSLRRKGYGRAAVLAFLHYIATHLQDIMDEYKKSLPADKMSLVELNVKIGGQNESSIRLFESIGFIQTRDSPNYFGEIELALEGSISEGKTAELLQKYGIQEYHEIPYIEVSS